MPDRRRQGLRPMTDDENEEIKEYLNQEAKLDHGVEWMIVIVVLALGIGCHYVLTHQQDSTATEAYQWFTKLLPSLSSWF
jgi:hypothetical protein